MSKFAGRTVRDILRDKRGGIKQAPLEPGAPAWDDILDLTYEQVEQRAGRDDPGYRTILKLLKSKRFDK